MLEETYLKEFDKENELCIISFEGDKEDIYELRDYAKMINSVKGEVKSKYYRGFSKNISKNNNCEHNYGKADYEMVVNPTVEIDIDEILNSMKKAPIVCYDDKDEDCCGEDACDILEEKDMVNKPSHYCSGKLETIEKIEAVINRLPAKQASCLANVLKYFDRAGLKDDAVQDLDKANNYAHRLVYGVWRHEH